MSAFLNTSDLPLLWLTLTLAAFWIAQHAQRLCGGSAIANPTLIAIVLLGSLLLATGNAELIEDSLSEPFWGIGPDGSGPNWAGRVLMEIRAELLATQTPEPLSPS